MPDYSWRARVFSSHQNRATVYIRKRQFEVGAPLQFDQEYDGVSALEHVLAAIGADLTNGMQAICRKRRLDVDRVEALVVGELNNPLVHLGVVGEKDIQE